jgi:hypothetical protein
LSEAPNEEVNDRWKEHMTRQPRQALRFRDVRRFALFSYICSRQRYSMYIVLYRLAHLQQSSNLQYRHRSIPTCANAAIVKASHPLAFQYIRTQLITCYVFRLFFVYMLSTKLQYKHCSIPTCASAAVVKATVQPLFNLI